MANEPTQFDRPFNPDFYWQNTLGNQGSPSGEMVDPNFDWTGHSVLGQMLEQLQRTGSFQLPQTQGIQDYWSQQSPRYSTSSPQQQERMINSSMGESPDTPPEFIPTRFPYTDTSPYGQSQYALFPSGRLESLYSQGGGWDDTGNYTSPTNTPFSRLPQDWKSRTDISPSTTGSRPKESFYDWFTDTGMNLGMGAAIGSIMGLGSPEGIMPPAQPETVH